MLEQPSLSKCLSCSMAPHFPTLLAPHSSKQGLAQGWGWSGPPLVVLPTSKCTAG